ncbi:MAG: LysR family transcriptional regulator [Gammaproteobacteria bacterium]|nr:LysR family transcriptional regulator [Gammaproteobacteria bacterium]
MQSRLLQSFLAVADNGSVTEAARQLNVSQPALTKSIQRLEEQLGVSLFDRASTGVVLTQYGNILRHHAKLMENEYRHAVTRIEELRDGRSGSIRIGAGPIWLVAILPPIVARFQHENPGVSISLVGGVIDTLLPDLLAGDLDLICVSLDFPNRSEIVKRPLIEVQHVLIADPSHPLSNKSAVKPDAIHHYPWLVLKSDYVGNERISTFFSNYGLSPPKVSLETTSIHSLLQGLRNGNYIAHIPTQLLPLANSMGLNQIRTDETIWETSAGYAYRLAAQPSASVSMFMERLTAEVPASA